MDETSGWREGKAVLRGWLQAGPNSAIGRYREAGKETEWWRDYNVSRQSNSLCHLRGHMPANSLRVHFHSEICSGSSSIILPDKTIYRNVAFILILSHADKFRLCVCVCVWDKHPRFLVLNVSVTKWGTFFFFFYQMCLPSHLEPRSEQQHFSPHQRALHW